MTAKLPQIDARKEGVALAWLEELEREQEASDRFLDAQLRLRAFRVAEVAVAVHQELAESFLAERPKTLQRVSLP